MKPMRLQKFMANAGVCSRREAEKRIASGQVAVNGAVVTTPGTQVNPETDRVTIQGKPVTLPEEGVTIALHKPAGYVVSLSQPQEKTVMELIDLPRRLNPIGRLDKESTGLLLLTTLGDLHNRLTHPRYDHEKEYVVSVTRDITGQALNRMAKGMPLMDSRTRPAVVKRMDARTFSIILKEGKNRQIRRMARKLGYEVQSLHRVRVGHVTLGNLPEGQWRTLSDDEVRRFDENKA